MAAGIETAGLALAVFPVVIGIVDWYRGRLNGRDIRNLAESLETNSQIFRDTLEGMLQSVVPPEELQILMSDLEGDAWRSSSLNDRVTDRLGQQAQAILGKIADIHKTVSKLQTKLPPQANAAIDQGLMERARLHMRYFIHGPHHRGSMKGLRDRIEDFRKLTKGALKLAPSRTRRSKSFGNLDLVQECAGCLYDTLQAGWRYNCNQAHPTNLQLDIWRLATENLGAGSSDKTDVKFSFLFASDVKTAHSDHWMTAEIAVSKKRPDNITASPQVGSGAPLVSSPTSSTTQPISTAASIPTARATPGSQAALTAVDLCAIVHGSEGRVQARRRRLSSFSGSNGHNYDFFIKPDPHAAVKTKGSLTLSEAFAQRSRLSSKKRVKLALMLAWGVLQISYTNWLRGKWTKDNLLLVLDDANMPSPYISHAFDSARRHSSASTLTPATSNQVVDWVQNASLFALAVFLLELCYNSSIEDLASAVEKNDRGEPSVWTPFLTASRLAATVGDELGLHYAQAVNACMHFPRIEVDVEGKPKDSADFARKIMDDVIEPLKKAAAGYGVD